MRERDVFPEHTTDRCAARSSRAVTDRPFEEMVENEDGWSDWVHPLPGYRMKCCDCGLVHAMEFAIVEGNGDGLGFNDGETDAGVIIFRARRA